MITTLITLLLSAKMNQPSLPVDFILNGKKTETFISAPKIFSEPIKKNDSNISTGAKSALVIDYESQQILYAKNIESKLAIASLTKIMTAVIAIEKIEDLKSLATIPYEATQVLGSKVWLKTGERISYEDLIKAMLIASGNDSAKALAILVGQTEENFIKLMNEKAKELGMKNTNYANAHGLDNPNNYSTAFDQSILARYALSKRIIKDTIEIQSLDIKSYDGVPHNLVNTNKLLGVDPEVKGFKTGSTEGAGECLITLAQNKFGNSIITILLNSQNRFEESVSLKEKIWATYSW